MKNVSENIDTIIKTIFIVVVFFGIIFLGRDLLPSQTDTIKFHDMTQFARIEEYSFSIRTLQIPPTYASHMNFGLGYPMFMFYAPTAYILGSFLHLLKIQTIDSVSTTFFLLWLIGISGIYAFLKKKIKDDFAAFTGALLYGTSPWWASEIFVRGNLATSAFLAFAPWSLWAIYSYKKYPARSFLLIMITVLSHNALSIIFIPILLVFSYFSSRKDRLNRVAFIFLAILSSSWFWVPALVEMPSTYTREVATMIKYYDHFLCLDQIWSAGFWGYGGSLKGCADGMSFMLGKIQILAFIAGAVVAMWTSRTKSLIYFEILTVLCLIFMTLPDSKILWSILTPIHAMQFPWRLLAIALIFVISVGGHFFHFLFEKMSSLFSNHFKSVYTPESAKYVFSIVIVMILIFGSSKFFVGQKISKSELAKRYLSAEYISNSAAFEAPEYLPKTVNRDFWLTFRDKNITPESKRMLSSQMNKFSPNPLLRIIGLLVTVVSIYFALWRHHTKKTLS